MVTILAAAYAYDRLISTGRYDRINFKSNELSCGIVVLLRFAIYEAPFNHNVLSLNVAELT